LRARAIWSACTVDGATTATEAIASTTAVWANAPRGTIRPRTRNITPLFTEHPRCPICVKPC